MKKSYKPQPATSRVGFLKKLYKIFNALMKLIPVLIEIVEDYKDDGKLNRSNVSKSSADDSQ